MSFLLTFSDIYSSLECHKAFKRAGIQCDIDNVPAELGLSCGYAVRCEAPDVMVINTTLKENSIHYSKIIALK
ncbi:MAG: DUF3343 domain-containing protein [Treponema sp.]|jgi:hypothetical protein|nr:DUF3343 domain-containing protein [Treponema sp.]